MPTLTLDPAKLTPPAAGFRERFDRVLVVDGDNRLSHAEIAALQAHPDYPRIRPAVTIDGIPQATVGAVDAVLAFVNRAKPYQLEAVPGVGRTTAQRIVEARPEGGYPSIADVAPLLPQGVTLDSLRQWAIAHPT